MATGSRQHLEIEASARIVEYGNLVGKKSTPYTPTSKHDYMHNKIMVLDDAVLTGSYNFCAMPSRMPKTPIRDPIVVSPPPTATISTIVREVCSPDPYLHHAADKDAPNARNAGSAE